MTHLLQSPGYQGGNRLASRTLGNSFHVHQTSKQTASSGSQTEIICLPSLLQQVRETAGLATQALQAANQTQRKLTSFLQKATQRFPFADSQFLTILQQFRTSLESFDSDFEMVKESANSKVQEFHVLNGKLRDLNERYAQTITAFPLQGPSSPTSVFDKNGHEIGISNESLTLMTVPANTTVEADEDVDLACDVDYFASSKEFKKPNSVTSNCGIRAQEQYESHTTFEGGRQSLKMRIYRKQTNESNLRVEKNADGPLNLSKSYDDYACTTGEKEDSELQKARSGLTFSKKSKVRHEPVPQFDGEARITKRSHPPGSDRRMSAQEKLAEVEADEKKALESSHTKRKSANNCVKIKICRKSQKRRSKGNDKNATNEDMNEESSSEMEPKGRIRGKQRSQGTKTNLGKDLEALLPAPSTVATFEKALNKPRVTTRRAVAATDLLMEKRNQRSSGSQSPPPSRSRARVARRQGC